MRVTALIDRELARHRDPQFLKPRSGPRGLMEQSVIAALREAGHEVTVVPLKDDVLAALDRASPDVVFNLTEHIDGKRTRAAEVPAMLDVLGLAYTGAGAAGHLLSNDKAVSKQIARDAGMHVPSFDVLPAGTARLRQDLSFPVIVKPRFGDGSEGITLGSLVRDTRGLARCARAIHKTMKQAAICEEFIDGRELAVGLVGNGELQAFPIRETLYGSWREGQPRFNTTLLKDSGKFRKRFGISAAQADLPEAVARDIQEQCKAVFHALELRDYARIDLRLDRQGRCFFIEANCNCDLTPGAFGTMAAAAGISYPLLIDRVVRLAAARRPRQRPRTHHGRPLFA